MSNRFEGFEVGTMIETGALAGLEIPAWIDQEITVCTVRAICQGGCVSGAYMPAVIYFEAKQTMAQHGSDIFDFIFDRLDKDGLRHECSDFGMMCSFYVSSAVQLWAAEALYMIEELEAELDEEDAA